MPTPPLAATPTGVDATAWAAACAAVREYCGWHIAPSVAEPVTVDGSGGYVQFLPTLHLTALTSITNDGTTVEDPEWSEAGMVRGACWTSKFRGVVANMTHGYDACPAEVLAVVTDMAGAGGRTGVSGYMSGPHQVQFGQTSAGAQAGAVGVSDLQRDVLDRYRIPKRP